MYKLVFCFRHIYINLVFLIVLLLVTICLVVIVRPSVVFSVDKVLFLLRAVMEIVYGVLDGALEHVKAISFRDAPGRMTSDIKDCFNLIFPNPKLTLFFFGLFLC